MALAFYMDEHVPRAITLGLRLRRIDVLTAFEDDHSQAEDPDLLNRATSLKRVLFTMDDDLLAEAVARQRSGTAFGGVIYGHQLEVSIGGCIDDLEYIALAGTQSDVVNQVLFLPL